jgi:hypothetical protein
MGWRRLHNEELHNLFNLPNVIRLMKSRSEWWAGRATRMGQMRNVYKVLIGNFEGKRPFGRPRRRWEDNIRMDIRGTGSINNTSLFYFRFRWKLFLRSAGLRAGWLGIRVPAGAGNFSLHHRVQTGSETPPASYYWVPGALSVVVKRPGREADHSPPSSAEVELYLHFSNTPSWRGAQLEGRGTNLTLSFLYSKGKVFPVFN